MLLAAETSRFLQTVNDLVNLYQNQEKLMKVEEMYVRTLDGYEQGLGRTHTSTLDTVHTLGVLCQKQGVSDELKELKLRFEQKLGGNEAIED